MENATQDVWFDSDTRIVAMNMTIREYHHWTLYKHPLFSIITWPITSFVGLFVSDTMTAMRIVQAANAGLVVVLLSTLLGRIGLKLFDRTLFALLFIASSTMLFWYTLPESFSFGGTTLLIALHATISARPTTRLGYLGHGLASLATLSMTITNWVAGLLATTIAYGLLDHPIRLLKRWLSDLRTIWTDIKGPVLISAAVLVTAMALALLQDAIFGEASVFFNVRYLLRESAFVGDYSVSHALTRPFVLLFSPIVVGTLGTWFEGTRLTADDFIPSTWTGIVALILWVTLFAGGLVAAVATMIRPSLANLKVRRMIIAAAITLTGFVLVHSVYGFIAFLYVAHTAPYVLALTAPLFLTRFRTVARALMVALILFAGYHNYVVFHQAETFVHETVPEYPLPTRFKPEREKT